MWCFTYSLGSRPQSPKQEDNWDDEIIQKNIEYHKFSKTFDSIRLIDTEQTFRSFLDKGLNVNQSIIDF